MGLDMYLKGKTYNFRQPPEMEGSFEVEGKILKLGYWRKHPNLHGYIVQTFADGVDECQPIPLNKEGMEKIIEAINNNELPPTEGFFFGQSDGSEDAESVEIFKKAIEWLEANHGMESRSVIYQASW